MFGPPAQDVECGRIKVPSAYSLGDAFLSGENPRDAVYGLSPWVLALEDEEQYVCGAVLVEPDWAVTSARCVNGR